MRRSFGIDSLACPRCGGRFALIAVIDEAPVIGRILRHLGLPTALPLVAAVALALVAGHRAAFIVAAQGVPAPRTMALTFDHLLYVRAVSARDKACCRSASRWMPNLRCG